MIKTIIVADEPIHTFLSERCPDWDTQHPVTSIEQMWNDLGSERISPASEIVILSDQYHDDANIEEDLELAIATLAPEALVMVISYETNLRPLIQEKVESIAARDGLQESPFYFVNFETPIEDIEEAIESYAAYKDGSSVSPQIIQGHDEIVDQEVEEDEPRQGMVLLSTSSKGGSGKSTTALLLASQIAKSSQKSVEEGLASRALDVCVVDLDVRDGQIGFLIGQMSPTALNIRAEGDWTPPAIRKYLVWDSRLGIHALLAPKSGRNAEDVPPEFYLAVIQGLRTMFDVVILDSSVNYLDPLIEEVCLPEADAILFVTDLGISSVFGMGRWFDEVTSPKGPTRPDGRSSGGMGIDMNKIGIVVNKSIPGVNMDRERVTQAAMGARMLAAIPLASADFFLAANRNRLDVMLQHPEVGPSYYNLARKVIGKRYPLADLVAPESLDKQKKPEKPARKVPVGVPPGKSSKAPQAAPEAPSGSPNYPGYHATPVEKKKRGFFGGRR
jgi:septum formation inhibitor-activating ATPase MinD